MAVVAIVTSAPPLTEGGHLVIARALVRAFEERGHRAGLVQTPSNRFGRQGGAYLANWFTDVGLTGDGTPIDQVISLRFPSYAVRHRRHVCWLNHTMREYYDLWDDLRSRLSLPGVFKESIRRSIVFGADRYLLSRNVRKLFVQSSEIQARLQRAIRVDSEVLHPPPPQRPYRCDGYGDYLFVPSRLSPLKRCDLVLRALAEPAGAGVRCVIGGDGEARAALETLARDLGVANRAQFIGAMSEATLIDHYARCRAVAFVPIREDYGFVAVEALASAKAVITCTDSGGPLELVHPRRTGWVVAPDPRSLAAALGEAIADPALAERLGTQGRDSIRHLTWDNTVDRLLIG
jgi:glycosyltransferase involved in cell wall biosynthesis